MTSSTKTEIFKDITTVMNFTCEIYFVFYPALPRYSTISVVSDIFVHIGTIDICIVGRMLDMG